MAGEQDLAPMCTQRTWLKAQMEHAFSPEQIKSLQGDVNRGYAGGK